MKEDRNTVLIVEDQKINRTILRYMIQNDYDVLEAENGAEAFEILEIKSGEIIAILLDIVMPVMDGYEFLEKLKDSPWDGIPVIAMTGDSDISTEEKTLELGAWDFIIKPYKERILRTRLKNAIARSRMGYLKQMKHMAEHDSVTGLYNRIHFFKKTEEMLQEHPKDPFAFIRMDIKRFRLINSYWGEEGGNRILYFMADLLRQISVYYSNCTFGRIESDIFGFCIPYEEKDCSRIIRFLIDKILSYRLKSELCIESRNAVNLCRLYSRRFRNMIYRLHGQIPVYFLGLLKNRDETSRHFRVLVKNRLQFFELFACACAAAFFAHVFYLPAF